MLWFFLFIFGLAIGSFLNVVALRYDGERFVFSSRALGGRSHCPHCKTTLQWYELIPLVSWIALGGRCRTCKAKVGWRYPLVELISGIIFVAVPLRFAPVVMAAVSASAVAAVGTTAATTQWPLIWLSAIWIVAFEILLLIAYIDIRLTIIPDELNAALAVLGLVEIAFVAGTFGIGNPSFFGAFAGVFGLQSNIWINHISAAAFGVAFFGAIVAATRGRGMGMGDVKFALPLGLLFGWPDVLIIAMMAFVIGGVYGLVAITAGKKTMKSAVPFGPFLVAASAIAFFAGSALFNWYFHMLGL
jgi:leader peptidase (prepilin peptidase) / N-methyltransferase